MTPETLAAVITGAVTLVAAFGGWTWIRKKLGELADQLAEKSGVPLVGQIDDYLEAMATNLYHSQVKALKESGEWNKELGSKMLSELANSALAAFGTGNIAGAAGISPTAVKGYIEGKAEQAVGTAKAKGRAKKAVAADPTKPST